MSLQCPRCKGSMVEFVRPVHVRFCHWCEYVEEVTDEVSVQELSE